MARSSSLGTLYVDLLAKTGGFETDMGRAARIAEKRAKEIDKAIGAGIGKITGVLSVGAAAVAGFAASFASIDAAVAAVKGAIDQADRLDELSARLDISTEKLSGWGYAAKLSGTDLEGLASAIPKLSKKIAEAADESSGAGKLFAAMGVKVKDAAGNLRDVEDVLPEIMDRFKGLKNDTLEQALAMEVFGKSGAEMLEFLNLGSQGLRTMEEDLLSLGGVIDSKTAAEAARFNDELDRLKVTGSALSMQLASELLPYMIDFTKSVTDASREGGIASGVIDGLGAAFDFFASRVRVATSLGIGFADMMQGLSKLTIVDFDPRGALDAFNRVGVSRQMIVDEMRGGGKEKPSIFANVDSSGSGVYMSERDQRLALARAKMKDEMEKRLLDYLDGGDKSASKKKGKTSSAGKKALTEEEKAAQALARAYESINERSEERIAFLEEEIRTGEKVSEVFKARYEIEHGALKGLEKPKQEEMIRNAELLDQLEKELKLRDEQLKINEQRKEAIDRVLEDMAAERDALMLTNEQLEINNRLRAAGVQAGSPEGQLIVAGTEEIQRLREYADTMDGVRNIAYDFLIDLPNGAKDAWKNALANIEQMLLQWAAKKLIEQVFGQFGSAEGGIFGGAGGADGGGGLFGTFMSAFGGGRASGGAVSGKHVYGFLERGEPEMVTAGGRSWLFMPPNMSGTVSPSKPLTSKMTTVINQSFHGRMTRQTASQAAQETGREAARALRRNGG